MRIGLMVGPERGRYATKVARMRADARWAEDAGLSTVWIPQIPDEFDALTAAAVSASNSSGICGIHTLASPASSAQRASARMRSTLVP